MKKITAFLFMFVFLFSMVAMANDSWILRVKAESWKMRLTWLPFTPMDYSDKTPLYDYGYKFNVGQSKGNLFFQGFSAAVGHTFFKERAEISGGIGYAKIAADMENPEFSTESFFTTIFGYNSPDKQVHIGDSVHATSEYEPFWFVNAKVSIFQKKNWEVGIEGLHLSISSPIHLPLQYTSNKWKGAEMEFSIKGNSMKFQMTEIKLFGNFKISKSLELSGAGGYLNANMDLFGDSLYRYKQYDKGSVNVDSFQKWEEKAKSESKWFAEANITASLSEKWKITITGIMGAKSGFTAGISYYPGKKKITTTSASPATKPNIVPVPPESIAPKAVVPAKSDAPKKATKPVAKFSAKKKTAVAPKEEAKPTVTKTKTIAKPDCTPKKIWKSMIFYIKTIMGIQIM